jgi:two-component system cell cycle sensor histidine kinase/response regulator CckA
MTEKKMNKTGNHPNERLETDPLETIGILAGSMAHNFNNFLTVIIGNIELLMEEFDPGDRFYSFLANAENSALKAADLAQKISALSRENWLNKERLDLRDIIDEIVGGNPAAVEGGGQVTYDIDIPGDTLPLHADRGRLKLVLVNLLRNAAEASANETGAERRNIQVKAANILSPDADIPGFENLPHQKHYTFVKISIRDRGRGIPRENLPRVFEPYFSTKSVADKGNKKTGLGLSLCFAIVRKHEGYMYVKPGEGEGVTVDVFIPSYRDAG